MFCLLTCTGKVQQFSNKHVCWEQFNLLKVVLTYSPKPASVGSGGTFSPHAKLPGFEANHTPSTAEVRKNWRYTSNPLYASITCSIFHVLFYFTCHISKPSPGPSCLPYTKVLVPYTGVYNLKLIYNMSKASKHIAQGKFSLTS
jgi:hypothetical protein